MKEKKEIKSKRYFATCVFCRTKYESDEMIKPCCESIMVNDSKKLRSKFIEKEI